MNMNDTANPKSPPPLSINQRYDSEASLVSIAESIDSTVSHMEQPHSIAVLGNITQVFFRENILKKTFQFFKKIVNVFFQEIREDFFKNF